MSAQSPTPALASERVIINAPMSFTGAAQRAWRLRSGVASPWVQWPVATPAVVCLLVLWWAAIVVWYVAFGLLLLPYRILRRGARKRKKQALQHREMMAAIEQANQGGIGGITDTAVRADQKQLEA